MSAAADCPWPLPAHFSSEEKLLRREAISSWAELAALEDRALRQLAASGAASEARLRRLRGQARLVTTLGLAAPQAALLLHAGIASAEALAEAPPHQLLRQLGRFQRQLLGRDASPISLGQLQVWITAARRHLGRPAK